MNLSSKVPLGVALVAALFVIILVVQNSEPVALRFLVFQGRASLVVVIAAAVLAGLAGGVAAGLAYARRRLPGGPRS